MDKEAIQDTIGELEDPKRRAALIARLRILADERKAPTDDVPVVEESTSNPIRVESARVAAFSERTLHAFRQLR